MFYCGIDIQRNILAIFLCYSVLSDVSSYGETIQPQSKTAEAEAPPIFPNNASQANGIKYRTAANIAKTSAPNLSKNACLHNVLKSVSELVVHHNFEKNDSSKLLREVRTTYESLVKNLTDNLLGFLIEVEHVYDFFDFGKCAASMAQFPNLSGETAAQEAWNCSSCEPAPPVVTTSNCSCRDTAVSAEATGSNSIVVPALSIIVLLLLTYVAFLHQKVRKLDYKSSHMLIDQAY